VAAELARWCVGLPPEPLGPADALVALTAAELAAPELAAAERQAAALGFHLAMRQPTPQATSRVDIYLPGYRGKSFIPVLGSLAASQLAGPPARVSWHLRKQQGPDSVLRLLAGLGWQLNRSRHGQDIVLTGTGPRPATRPRPRSFTAVLGDHKLSLAADYGVFSPTGLDDGTELLLGIALRAKPTSVVADVGTGYGPLAIGLVRNRVAERAVATEVDCVALWLAELNAEAAGVELDARCSPDPGAIPATGLTVCNVPTHIDAEQSASLMAGLLARARHGRLLIVVHRSLEARYARYFTAASMRVRRHPGRDHVVLDCG
jgi:16S rRNA G1207 methylase RsmC